MTLKITYYSECKIHKSIHRDVTYWYYTDGNLVIISGNDELILHNVVLLRADTWVPKKYKER